MRLLLAGALIPLTVLPGSVRAQATWLTEEAPVVTVELLRPSFGIPRFDTDGQRSDDDSPTSGSGALFLGVRYPWRVVDFVAELPLAFGGLEQLGTGVLPGNVYLGAEIGPYRSLSLRAGLRLPTSPDPDSSNHGPRVIGLFASPGDRLQSFDPMESAFVASIQHVARPSRFVEMRFSAGATRVAYEQSETLALLMAGQAILDYEATRVGAGILLNLNVEDAGENAIENAQQFEVWADHAVGRFRPGIVVRRILGVEAIGQWENPLVLGLKVEAAL